VNEIIIPARLQEGVTNEAQADEEESSREVDDPAQRKRRVHISTLHSSVGQKHQKRDTMGNLYPAERMERYTDRHMERHIDSVSLSSMLPSLHLTKDVTIKLQVRSS
jgi:hypothetical protein